MKYPPRWLRGLSARLLVLTAVFVMLSEVLIYVPSIARFRLTFLQDRIADAHLASLALKATPDNVVSRSLELELLANAMVHGIVLKRREARTMMLMADMPPKVDAVYDLRGAAAWQLIVDAFMTLSQGQRTLRVVGGFPDHSEGGLEVIVDEAQLHGAMVDYSTNIMKLSLVISLLTAGLVFLSLQLLLVAPMRRITASMVAFRKAPENTNAMIADSARSDEIGTAQRELRHMQGDLRAALNLRELADDAVAYAGLPGDGGISWRNDVPAELTINADRDQMFRVLMNLARNAIQAMPGGGAMTLTAECGPDGVVMDFGDNGPGLPEKARAHLFEAFTGAARAGGTGLGLAIAKELVVAHGGELSLVSSDGDGTRFRIDLPDGSP